MDLDNVEPTEEEYAAAAVEATRAEALARAEEAMKVKQAKTEALLKKMRVKAPQQGKVRVILPFQLLLDDTTQGDKVRARVVDTLFSARQKNIATLMNAAVVQLPIAAAVRAVGEVVQQSYPMLELQFASKQLAIEFMTGEPPSRNGEAEFLPPPQRPILKQVRYLIWDRRECGIQPGAAVWYALEGYENLVPTITHTLGEHDGMVVRAYVPHPSAALLMNGPGPQKDVEALFEIFWDQAVPVLGVRKNMIPRDGGSVQGADILIPQGLVIDVLIKDGANITYYPADLPDNGVLRWALEGVHTLPFFHTPGDTPQPQDRAHKRMLGYIAGTSDKPGAASTRHQRRKEGKRIQAHGSKEKTPCKFFFEQGYCRRGDFCDFSHDPSCCEGGGSSSEGTQRAVGESSGKPGPEIYEI